MTFESSTTTSPDVSLDLSPCQTPANITPEPRSNDQTPTYSDEQNKQRHLLSSIKEESSPFLTTKRGSNAAVSSEGHSSVDERNNEHLIHSGLSYLSALKGAQSTENTNHQNPSFNGLNSAEMVFRASEDFFNSATSQHLAGSFPFESKQQQPRMSSSFSAFGVPPYGQVPSNNTSSMKIPNSMTNHRNTMPSLASSPFAFDTTTNGIFNSAFRPVVNPAAQQVGAGVYSTSLSCYLVQFTSGRTDTYYIPTEANFRVQINDYVVVEADRGEDLGKVLMDNINVPMPRRNSTSSAAPPPNNLLMCGYANGGSGNDMDDMYSFGGSQSSQQQTGPSMPKKIYRVAQPIEIESLLGKIRDEINAISVGQYKVQEWKLPMAIIDAEYQWDRRKLTFFFSVTLPQFHPRQTVPRIDFRTLVRDLYQIYRTRIWMYCIDKDKTNVNRSHNREKFLAQLQKDVARFHGGASGSYGNAIGNGRPSMSGASVKSCNSLKALLEQDESETFQFNEADLERDFDKNTETESCETGLGVFDNISDGNRSEVVVCGKDQNKEKEGGRYVEQISNKMEKLTFAQKVAS